jgi:hypothetical protein
MAKRKTKKPKTKKTKRATPPKPRTTPKRAKVKRAKVKRGLQVKSQVAERLKRSRKGGKLKASYTKRARGAQRPEVTGSGKLTKTVYRFHGVHAPEAARDKLLELPARSKVYVNVGTGYQRGAQWVGSRVTHPRDASLWLQSVGQSYRSVLSPSGERRRSKLAAKVRDAQRGKGAVWVEIVALSKRGKR